MTQGQWGLVLTSQLNQLWGFKHILPKMFTVPAEGEGSLTRFYSRICVQLNTGLLKASALLGKILLLSRILSQRSKPCPEALILIYGWNLWKNESQGLSSLQFPWAFSFKSFSTIYQQWLGQIQQGDLWPICFY